MNGRLIGRSAHKFVAVRCGRSPTKGLNGKLSQTYWVFRVGFSRIGRVVLTGWSLTWLARGSLIRRIHLEATLNSRHAHISSKEYFEETYSKFSKWTSTGGRQELIWFWLGSPVFRVSWVEVVVENIVSPKWRLFESMDLKGYSGVRGTGPRED